MVSSEPTLAISDTAGGLVFDDAKAAYLAVKKTGRVVQVGTQRRSDPAYMPQTVLLNEVEPKKRYEVVITNFYGKPLLRYRTYDIVEFPVLEGLLPGSPHSTNLGYRFQSYPSSHF